MCFQPLEVFLTPPSISKFQVAVVEVNVVAGTIRDPTLVPGSKSEGEDLPVGMALVGPSTYMFKAPIAMYVFLAILPGSDTRLVLPRY